MDYYSKHNSLRMVDYKFIAYNPELISSLNVISFMYKADMPPQKQSMINDKYQMSGAMFDNMNLAAAQK